MSEVCAWCGCPATYQRTRLTDGVIVMKCICLNCLLRIADSHIMPRPKCAGCGKYISREYFTYTDRNKAMHLACCRECVARGLGYTRIR